MAEGSDNKPSWAKFANYDGPSEDERTEALRAMRAREGHSGMCGTGSLRKGSPRKTKYGGAQFVGAIRIR